jgi:hypothetical protein
MQDDCNRKKCTFRHIKINAETRTAPASEHGPDLSKRTLSKLTDLPRTAMERVIPVNSQGQRLDHYVSPPSRSQLGRYYARCKVKKLCNALHLDGGCNYADCELDHRPIDRELQHVLRFSAMSRPCNRNKHGSCRRPQCNRGHVCQRTKCLTAGKRTGRCIIAEELHGVDFKLHMWVAAKGYAAPSASDGTEASVDELESSHDGAGDDVRDSPGYILGFGNVVYDLIDI